MGGGNDVGLAKGSGEEATSGLETFNLSRPAKVESNDGEVM